MKGVTWGALKAALDRAGVDDDTRIKEIAIRPHLSGGFEIGIDRDGADPIWLRLIED